MKKIFTLAAAVLASVAMMAQTITLSTADKSGNWYEVEGVGRVANKSGNAFSDPDMTCEGSTGFKTGSSYFTIQTYQNIDALIIWARSTSNRTISKLTVSDELSSSTPSSTNVEYTMVNEESESYAIPKNACDNEFTITFANTVAANSYIQILFSGNAEIVAVTLVAGEITPSTDPVLAVNPAEVTFAITAAKTEDEATVKFTGKNLVAGTYNLTIPNLAGLTVNPTSVTVGEDGKLNAEVTIAYASTVDVEAANTTVSLTIGELTQSVTVNYSAVLAKQYLNASLNIEQLVLDNGINYSITDAFAAANIEAENIDKLDSLNDEKANRNYAYLGLKLKKEDAKLACWLQTGHSIKVRFGNVGADFIVRANGVETPQTSALANATVESAVELPFTATEDTYLEIICNSTKTLVIKQIMLDEEIQAVTLPEPLPTGINNTNAAVKAVKVVRNGQLFIEKNGVVYNAQGTIVR